MTTKVVVTTYANAAGVTLLNSEHGDPTGPEEIVAANSEKEFSVTSTTGIAIREMSLPKQWPQWIDGVLYNSEGEYQSLTAPPTKDQVAAKAAADKAADDKAAADAAAADAAAKAADTGANNPATSSGKGKASSSDAPISGVVEDTKGKS